MKRINKLFVFLVFFVVSMPSHAENFLFKKQLSFGYTSKKTLAHNGFIAKTHTPLSQGNFEFISKTFKGATSIGIYENDTIHLDDTYIQSTFGRASLGAGSIERNWSFSPNSSLILSKNARPFHSVYFKLVDNDGFNMNWLSAVKNTSIEMFNGIPESNENPKNSMLFGLRMTLSINDFDLEAIRTSQWGGNGHSYNSSIIPKVIFGNSNEGNYANINQMAGIGLSYSSPKKTLPLRIFGQVVGEDEAGNLPSCLMYLLGLEWNGPFFGKKSNIGIETIDTTIDYTSNGNCGPNTAYNNGVYKYTNKRIVMGAPIDSEGSSFEIFGKTKLSTNLSSNFTFKKSFINKNNDLKHRLTSIYTKGWTSSLGLEWRKDNIVLNGKINYQDFSIEKINSSNGLGFNISSSIYY